jgi:predicted metal-dependent hydrolase
MIKKLKLGEITVDVIQKDIKNVHLSAYPPNGRVKISAPLRMSAETIRVFAISKIGWIRQQQAKLRCQDRESPREYLDRESHYVWVSAICSRWLKTRLPRAWRWSRVLYAYASGPVQAKRQERRSSQVGIANYSRQRFRP